MPKFKVVGGPHVERQPDGSVKKTVRGSAVTSRFDLAAMFNTPRSTKFEKVGDDAPEGPADEYEAMNNDQLSAALQKQGLEADDRADAIQKLRAARANDRSAGARNPAQGLPAGR